MPYSGVDTGGDYVALPQAIIDVYSMDILHEAQGVMRFEDFAVQKTELQKTPGETITMTQYNNLTRGGELSEDTPLTTENLSATQKTITVTEWGKATGVSEKLLQMSYDDVLAEAAVLLGRDYAVVNDLMCRDALVLATQVIYAGDAPDRASLTANDYFDVEMIRQGVEILQTKNAPKFLGDFYVCFIHPHQAAYLKRDPDWVSAQNYANTRALFTGEIGRWEDVVFIGTTHCRNGAAGASDPGYEATMVDAAAGGTLPVYEGILFSDSAYGKATGLPVEMRDDGVSDFGRKHSLAWYSIMGAKILEDDFVILLESV